MLGNPHVEGTGGGWLEQLSRRSRSQTAFHAFGAWRYAPGEVTTTLDVPVVATDRPAGPDYPSRFGRLARFLGGHLLAIALFAIPSVILWWHVWSGHPSATLTCGCGDPAQQVWFTAWPAWAVAHLHNPFFSGAVNVPDGANLLSNTSGTLVGLVLAPVTWLAGPVFSTNVALTLAPALSAWGCWVAVRRVVTVRVAAVPAALMFGYSAAVLNSLMFGHVSVTVLVVPPLFFSVLHDIVIRQEHSVRRDALTLAALVVVQFLISPEVLVMCLLLGTIGILAAAIVGWSKIREKSAHALLAIGIAAGISVVLLAYPAWYGLRGPQSVSGVLFALAPLTGVPVSGFLSPGAYSAAAGKFERFGGYLGQSGPPSDYVGAGAVVLFLGSALIARRRPLTWMLVFMTIVTIWLALGDYVISAPHALSGTLSHLPLPWRTLSKLPVFKEILADQFSPFVMLFPAVLVGIGLDAAVTWIRRSRLGAGWSDTRRRVMSATGAILVVLVAMIPVWATFDTPFIVRNVQQPKYMAQVVPRLPDGTVLLTVPFAVTGSMRPMLWQAVDDMHFRLAGAGLKTPNAHGGPVNVGLPGSARRMLSDLTFGGVTPPPGTAVQAATMRRALRMWHVDEVVVAGKSVDPVYASGFLTSVLGRAPAFVNGAWVWKLRPGSFSTPPAIAPSLAACEAAAKAPALRKDPLAMSRCVLLTAGQS
jgi:hypothetical protein